MKETGLQKALAFIHLIFILSLTAFLTIAVSGTILLLPSICAAFAIGRDLLEGKFNVYDGLIKRFYKELWNYRQALRFFPAQLILYLQLFSLAVFAGDGSFTFRVVLIVIAALLLTFIFYACAYMIFIDEAIRCEVVVVKMMMQVGIFISLFILMLLLLLFISTKAALLLFVAGALILLLIEACIYYTIKKTEDILNKE